MKITRLAGPAEVAATAADRLQHLSTAEPEAVIALPTGRTPIPSKVTAIGHLPRGFATPQWSATFLAEHPRLELLVDSEAAVEL